jgi:hypothetical protein
VDPDTGWTADPPKGIMEGNGQRNICSRDTEHVTQTGLC